MVRFHAPVSGRQFSISVIWQQRLGSKSHETGSILMIVPTREMLGAVGGAAVNYAFVEHFQKMARGHFTVRRLERVYGKAVVRTEYERLAQYR
jgi:hypothetical protein